MERSGNEGDQRPAVGAGAMPTGLVDQREPGAAMFIRFTNQ